jgi:hypothetical protein
LPLSEVIDLAGGLPQPVLRDLSSVVGGAAHSTLFRRQQRTKLFLLAGLSGMRVVRACLLGIVKLERLRAVDLRCFGTSAELHFDAFLNASDVCALPLSGAESMHGVL